ncbi:Uncharacterised protein [uncultured archaeon]|nr:Uncharacterised protein [uncultured archaeon]
MLLKIRDKFYILIYLIIIFVILISFITDKHLFLLDIILGTGSYNNLEFYGKIVPIYGGTLSLNLISMISQKLLIFIILLFSVYSMYGFINKIISSRMSSFYAGLLYMLNSYVYVRIMAGQLYLLFSYAILPLLLKVFINLLEKKEKKEMIKFIFLLSVVAFNIHILIIALTIMSIIFLFWFNKHRDIRISKIIIISVILFIILNSYWIIPILTAKNTMVGNIGETDYKVYAPKIEGISGLFDLAAMYGFWREGYLYTKDFLLGWQVLYLIILSLAIIGFLSYYKDQKIGIYIKAFAVIGIIGFILASGVNGPFGDIVKWLFDNTILKGFRDSHKFVAMMVLSYSVLGGLGIAKFEEIRLRYTRLEN